MDDRGGIAAVFLLDVFVTMMLKLMRWWMLETTNQVKKKEVRKWSKASGKKEGIFVYYNLPSKVTSKE